MGKTSFTVRARSVNPTQLVESYKLLDVVALWVLQPDFPKRSSAELRTIHAVFIKGLWTNN